MDYLNIKLQGIDHNRVEKTYQLSDFTGNRIVLYFYPKDATPVCTQQADDFRDNFNLLTDKATVIGVSPDDIESHKKFHEKQKLNFILLSDTEHELAEAFNVWEEKSLYGQQHMGVNRSTFILDKQGKIEHEWHNVKADGHVDEILDYLSK